MDNDLSVLLKVILDSSGIGSGDISKIQKILEKYTVNVAAELDKTQLMNSVKQVLPQVIKEISKLSGTNIKIDIDDSLIEKSIDQVIQDGKRLEKEFTSTAQRINKIQLSMDNGTYESKVESLIAKTNQWTDTNGNARISTNELSKAFDQLTTASNNYANSPTEAHQKALIASEKELDKQIKTVTNSVRSMNAELAKDSKISSLHNQLADFMSKNGKTVRYFGNDLRDIFNQTTQGSKLTNQELAVLKQRFIDVQNVARNVNGR